MAISIGSAAPEISLPDQGDLLRESKSVIGKILVVFFYPKDNTPRCTEEVRKFQENLTSLKSLGSEVWGVSGENRRSHEQFSLQNNLTFPLLCDKSNKLRIAFNVPSIVVFLPGRVTYLIDEKGIIVDIFNNLLNNHLHIQRAFEIITNIKKAK